MITVVDNKVQREKLPPPRRDHRPAPGAAAEPRSADRARKRPASPAGPREEASEPSINHYLLIKVGMVLLGITGVGSLAFGFLVQPRIDHVGVGKHVSPEERELSEILERLRSTWDAKVRARILDEAAENAWRFGGPLHRILRQKSHPLLEPAVEYAGALGVLELRPDVAALAESSKARLRPRAIQAAEQLGSWPSEQLAAFLTDEITPVQIAALEVVSRRSEAPWEQAFALLVSPDDGVRHAALDAVPSSLPPEARKTLWSIVRDGDRDQVRMGLRAIARTEITAEDDKMLGELLSGLERDSQLAALDALSTRKSEFQSAAAVWALATNLADDVRVRARALYCLEQTLHHDAAELGSWIDTEPLPKYFVARGLVQARDSEGVRILLELVSELDAEAAMASRRLLAELSGMSPTAGVDDFREALLRADSGWQDRVMSAPAVTF